MKIAVLVVGLVVLLVGVLGALYGWITASTAETSYAVFCTGGNPEPFPGWCDNLLSLASTYRTVAYVMTAVFVVGLALTVGGAAMKAPPAAPLLAMPAQPAPPPNPWRACKNCAKSMPSTDRFCPSCGTAQW